MNNDIKVRHSSEEKKANDERPKANSKTEVQFVQHGKIETYSVLVSYMDGALTPHKTVRLSTT